MSARQPFIEHTDSAWHESIKRAEARRQREDEQNAISVRQMRAADAAAKAAARRARGSIWLNRADDKRAQAKPWGTDDWVSLAVVLLAAAAIGCGWVFGGRP